MISSISYNNPVNFGAKLNSPRLRYSQKDFFIKIKGYGKDSKWANEVIKVADAAVFTMRNDGTGEAVLNQITRGVSSANRSSSELGKRIKSGILRTERDNWLSVDDTDLKTCYITPRYSGYAERLDNIYKKPLDAPFNNIAMSRPVEYQDIFHSGAIFVNNSLDYVFELYKKIFPRFSENGIKKENLNEVNDVIAEIRWLLAHATPWLRGSDAISNVFMRAMYKAVGVKTYPPAKGVSFDLEAYCLNLNEYKKKFVTFFEKPPVVVE